MRYLALDIGSVRVGLAVSDRDATIANPLTVLPAQDVFNVAPSFKRILEDWEPDCLVVGLPKTLAGETGPQAEKVKAEADALAKKLNIPMTFVDERFSSKEAKQSMAASGMKQKDMKGKVDKVAAALFLQTFLDSREKTGEASKMKNTSSQNAKHAKKISKHKPALLETFKKKVPAPFRYGIYVLIALLLALLVGSLAFCHHHLHKNGDVVTVQIAQGASGTEIAQELIDKDLIDDARQYINAVNDLNASKSIQSGTYEFVVGTSINDIVKQLMQGPNTSNNRLTIPEGSTVSQTADAVQKALGISSSDFLAAAKATSFVGDYPFLEDAAKTSQNSLEGYLWPSTYDFTGQEISATDIIKRMLDEFEKQSNSIDWEAGRARIQEQYGLNFSNYDFIKMASSFKKKQQPKTINHSFPLFFTTALKRE